MLFKFISIVLSRRFIDNVTIDIERKYQKILMDREGTKSTPPLCSRMLITNFVDIITFAVCNPRKLPLYAYVS